jgi:hypothetical protein
MKMESSNNISRNGCTIDEIININDINNINHINNINNITNASNIINPTNNLLVDLYVNRDLLISDYDYRLLFQFFVFFKYNETEITTFFNSIDESNVNIIYKLIYYFKEILVNYHKNCNIEFDSMESVFLCEYGNILKFYSTEHDKFRYCFVSKIRRNN